MVKLNPDVFPPHQENFCLLVNKVKKWALVFYPKAGATLMMNVFVKDPDLDIRSLILGNQVEILEQLGELNDYYKCMLVRNSYDRCLSGYLNLYHHYRINGCLPDYIKNLPAKWMHKGCSFLEFVNYLAKTPNSELDRHYWPQKKIFGHVDQICYLDQVVPGLSYFLARVGYTAREQFRMMKMVTDYKFNANQVNSELQFETSIVPLLNFDELNYLYDQGTPAYKYFFTTEIIEKICKRYWEEIQIFGFTPPQFDE